MEIDRGAICCLELAAALAAADAAVAAVDADIDDIAQLSVSLKAARSAVRIRDAPTQGALLEVRLNSGLVGPLWYLELVLELCVREAGRRRLRILDIKEPPTHPAQLTSLTSASAISSILNSSIAACGCRQPHRATPAVRSSLAQPETPTPTPTTIHTSPWRHPQP